MLLELLTEVRRRESYGGCNLGERPSSVLMEQAQCFFNTDIVNVGCERRLLGKLCQELVEGVPSNAEMVDYRLSLQVEVGI